MSRQFRRHYSRDEARALLPAVQAWLDRLLALRERIVEHDRHLAPRLEAGADNGGDRVHQWLQDLVGFRTTLREFEERGIQLKDLDRGLVDFPALRAGREVFLCWQSGEDDVGFWHELEAGYAGREPLELEAPGSPGQGEAPQ